MANKIIIKKSSVAGKVPVPADLEVGELAVNLADRALYSKDAGGAVVQLGGGSGSGDVVGPSSATDNALVRFDGATGKLIQNGLITSDDAGNVANINSLGFDTTPTTVPTTEGSLYWDSADGNQTLSLVMAGGNAVQQIGQEQYYRIKASSAITNGQVVMFTGTVGASGALTGAPATGLTAATASYVMGIATQDIALNGWGYITAFGLVRQINTSAFSDGAILYYDPSVTGGLTTTIPSAPNAKVQVCAVVHAASNGSLFVRPSFGGILGQYEGDVNIANPLNGQLLIRDQTSGKWVNANLTAGTGISITNAAGSVTIANSGVTSVTGTSPVASSGGATPAISLATAYGDTQNPYGSKTANYFLAAPNGSAGSPSFRAIVAADIPTLNQNTTGTAAGLSSTLAIASGGTGATSASAALTALGAQAAATAITTSNIGSQSVSYATSAGNADTLDGQHGAYYQPASTAITTSNIGSQSVNYATAAGSATSATSASNADTVDNLHAVQFFNNMGNNHSTYTDFNAPTDFGYRYMQGTTNGPGIAGATQYYNWGAGLGNDYAYTSYAMQMAIPRAPLGGSPYIAVRYREGGTWNSWSKIYAGYADTAGSTTNFMSTSHAGTYWLVNNWDGSRWYITSNHGAGVRVSYADSAGSVSGNCNGLAITGFGNGNQTYYQSSGTFAGYSGWAGYFISSHGDGATYYNQTIITPFWSAPKYSRQQGNTTTVGPYTFGTTENFTTDSWTATAAQTTFNTSATYASSRIEVFANGIKMVNGSDVTVTSGNQVIFAAGLASGTNVQAVYTAI